MRNWLMAATVAAAASVAAGSAWAEIEGVDLSHCEFPEAPTVPDGNNATEAQMGQAGADVRAFVAEVQTSLKCLAEVEESMGEEITEEQQHELVVIYNNGVDQMNAVAQDYNEQVKVYKSR